MAVDRHPMWESLGIDLERNDEFLEMLGVVYPEVYLSQPNRGGADESGQFVNFQMNDKCAAGTGKFLEVMAQALGYPIDIFARVGINETKPARINSMCTVFAESEVVSLVSKRVKKEAIVLGLHEAIAGRIASMANRVGVTADVVFSGGVARNPTMVALLERKLKTKLKVADAPDIIGALGAALVATNRGE